MGDALRSDLIRSIANQLISSEYEASALAREILSESTSARRRTEALILRAAIQTRSIELLRELEQLEHEPSNLGEVGLSLLPAERHGRRENEVR